MRMDVDERAFTTVAQGGVLAEVDVSDCFQVGFAVKITAIAGAPTNLRAFAVPYVGTEEVGSVTENIRKTADITATGEYFLGQRGSAVGEIGFENVYKKIRVLADFTAGTAPTITGTLYIFSKRF